MFDGTVSSGGESLPGHVILNADLQWFGYAARKLALQRNPIPFPNLKYLALELKKFDIAFHHDNPPMDALFLSPELETFAASELDWDTSRRFGFLQLTMLHIGVISGNHVALFLSHLPALQSLRVDDLAQIYGVQTLPATEIVHKTLSSLLLSTGSCYSQFWHGLRLPKPNAFHLSSSRSSQGRRESDLLEMSSVLRQLGCKLWDTTFEGSKCLRDGAIPGDTTIYLSADTVLQGAQSGANGERYDPVALALQCLLIPLSPFKFFPDPLANILLMAHGSIIQISKLRECRFNLTPDPFYIGEGWGGGLRPEGPEFQPPMYRIRRREVQKSVSLTQCVEPPPPPLNCMLAQHDVKFMDMVKTRLVSMNVRCFFNIDRPPLECTIKLIPNLDHMNFNVLPS
ncbi:hypothetical protein GYMLUDRAFT_236705 [Collybiopsis luxurians FD-317 M1]|nr:hypothetical protein GYMLUDRAFT_236705 [Collybiopsis luxurians FD-317 M1]